MSKIEVNTVEPQCGTTLTLGGCGQTVALGSGASQTGFGRTGTVDWQTGDIKTSEFTAATGKGYFVNTTSGTVTVNLPAGTAGDIVGLKDYAATWDSNAITLAPNGSEKIGGANDTDPTVDNEGGSLLLVYVDSTQGWLTTQQSVTASPSGAETYIVATGGTPCTGAISGDYKYHTFTAPGTFTVCTAGTGGVLQTNVSYMVVAGGGGGGGRYGGGGGAGGFREAKVTGDPYTASPLDAGTGITVTAQGYPITVGGGGAGGCGPSGASLLGTSGSDSIFSTITSAGGGGGTGDNSPGTPAGAADGGSGGGSSYTPITAQPFGGGGAGNTPPVSPAQGTAGGDGGGDSAGYSGGGGGGATVAGTAGNNPGKQAGPGGTGATTSINATPTARAGGGGGGANAQGPGTVAFGTGGTGGGGAGGPTPGGNGVAGTVNTGGGGGGASAPGNPDGGTGGSGIVIIRYKFQ
jgi:hypothetical protein